MHIVSSGCSHTVGTMDKRAYSAHARHRQDPKGFCRWSPLACGRAVHGADPKTAMSRTHVTTRDQLLSASPLHMDSRKRVQLWETSSIELRPFSPMQREHALSQLIFVVKIVCDTAASVPAPGGQLCLTAGISHKWPILGEIVGTEQISIRESEKCIAAMSSETGS